MLLLLEFLLKSSNTKVNFNSIIVTEKIIKKNLDKRIQQQFYMKKVLVIATSRKTRGGITSVIKAHEMGRQWKDYHCKWIETHRDGNSIRKLWYLAKGLIQYICLLPSYDIVHIHVATTQSAKRKLLFFLLAKWAKKKIILHFHPSNEKFLFTPYNQKLYKKLFATADLTLVLSDQWKKWIKEATGLTDRIEVLYNPCPIVNRKNHSKKTHILFAGTIIPRKGYETLLRGFALIAHKYPTWKIIFIGNGEIENGKKLAETLDIESQVSFLGWISGRDKETIFQESSIYCLASNGEGFPMGILDAWAYGIPCIMTPVGGIPDIVRDGENGLIFEVSNYHQLAIKIEILINEEDLRNKIVAKTDKNIANEFNINIINEKLYEIYSRF